MAQDNGMAMTLSAALRPEGPSTTRADVRSHTLYIDRPLEKGGADRGPRGGEYLLVAVGGCFSTHLLAAIRARDAKIEDVRVDISGTVEGSPERFTSLQMTVEAACHDGVQFQKLVTIAERACQVINTVRRGIRIEVTVRSRPVVPHA